MGAPAESDWCLSRTEQQGDHAMPKQPTEDAPATMIPPGLTLYELWHQRGEHWIEKPQPVPLADGDPPLESDPDEHEVARMIDEGCPHHD